MKVAIVAKAGTSALAPWHDEEWEIWGMPWVSYPRVTRLFDVHAFEPDIDQKWWDEYYHRKYRDIPVYCVEERAHLYHKPVIFPLAEVLAEVPFLYLENTIAYEIGLAIAEGAEEIALYGIHMMGLQYFRERPSVTYLIGLAQGRGIKVTMGPGSPLFMSRYVAGRYGVDTATRDNVDGLGGIPC